MRRSENFSPSHEPFRTDDSLSLLASRTSGPFSFFNPTRAHFHHSTLDCRLARASLSQSSAPPSISSSPEKPSAQSQPPKSRSAQNAYNIQFQWRSRDNRKGRHALLVDTPPSSAAPSVAPTPTSTLSATARGIARMFTYYPIWDISYLVAVIFTLGSVVWVINAFFVWLPLQDPSTEFTNEISVGGGWTAFIGATIFEIGSVLLMLEAVNENRAGCFGWALENIFDHEVGRWTISAAEGSDGCVHHHANKKNFVGKGPHGQAAQDGGKAWRWLPTWHELSTHYIRELGFLACLAQFFGATIFWISGFTALPAIFDVLAVNQKALNGAYWAPQIIGGSGFTVSGVLFMLETQEKWYLPAPGVLGWHVGLWNLIGAFGFTLCGALGPAYGSTGAQFEASLATFWGSWAFLIGSVIQWYESLDTHPVEAVKEKDVTKHEVR